MNDLTPGRLTGTLLERAAAHYALQPPARPFVAEPVVEPRPDPAPIVPPARTGVIRIDRDALAAAGMIVPGAAVGALAEEFRLVKRALLLTARAVAGQDVARARTVLVCSANPGEGKTYCAINLALSLAAEQDIAVLLVDADFAQPDVLNRLGVNDAPGLLDALADRSIDPEALVIPTDVPQLSILPAGARRVSDTELLASGRAREVLARLLSADGNRIIIFDSPPALAASPASVLAEMVGQVLLVVRADRTSEGDLRKAVALLDACDDLQLVLNAVAYQLGTRRFGSYYGQDAAA
jgi:exopolysaccharide/PEP-CTERM locus tyrosine autokinase